MIVIHRELDAPAPAVWAALVDLDAWPSWGPTISGATLHDGGRHLHAGAEGQVRTAVGVSLPFTVTEWEPGVRWAWRVGGVPATSHGVEPLGLRCRAWIGVPSWAPLYAPVCRVALGRLGRVAASSGRS